MAKRQKSTTLTFNRILIYKSINFLTCECVREKQYRLGQISMIRQPYERLNCPTLVPIQITNCASLNKTTLRKFSSLFISLSLCTLDWNFYTFTERPWDLLIIWQIPFYINELYNWRIPKIGLRLERILTEYTEKLTQSFTTCNNLYDEWSDKKFVINIQSAPSENPLRWVDTV